MAVLPTQVWLSNTPLFQVNDKPPRIRRKGEGVNKYHLRFVNFIQALRTYQVSLLVPSQVKIEA